MIRRIPQILIALLLVAGVGLLVTEMVGSRSSNSESPSAASATKYFIVEATRPVARGSVIRRDAISLHPSDMPPVRGVVTDLADAVDRIASRDIAIAEAISEGNSAAAVKGENLSNLVPPGLRAIALHVSDDTAVANLIRPGDKVDVLVVSNASRAVAGSRVFPPAEVVTMLQNITVLAVGGATVGSGSANAQTRDVTLAVTPEQAAMVALVRSVGSEYLSLRSAGDDAMAAAATASSDMLQPKKPVPDAKPLQQPSTPSRAPGRVVEVISGASNNTSRVSVEGGNR